MLSGIFFQPVRSQWSDLRTYFFIFLFATGNLLFPQLCHLVPRGGQVLLPIYFFTLIGSYKFGSRVGIATAVLSPLLNSALFGMPPLAAVPVIMVKSMVLALVASQVASANKKLSVLLLLYVVVAYQLIGSSIEWMMTQSLAAAAADVSRGIPGMLLQVFAGWWILKKLALYDRK